ncbi:MAG TPA: hypothetical protein VGW74_18655 [Propionibacteriaceae bacterium]|nr:hypothetical protein [Propionibacteriaceae bacterium]
MFEASVPVRFFDYFRVPYRVLPVDPWPDTLPQGHPLRWCGLARWAPSAASGRALRWPLFDQSPPGSPLRASTDLGEYHLGSIPIYGRLLPDDLCRERLAETGIQWTRSTPVRDRRGARVASEWRGSDGSRFLPYDPSEVIQSYWSEAYRDVVGWSLARPVKTAAMAAYYRARPLLPRAAQIWMRRRFSHVQARARFPRWPVETALHDLYAKLFDDLTQVAGEPVPFLSPWPNGHSWSLVLTHDVETAAGYEKIHVLRDLELGAGYRSSWNFVPKRYAVDDRVVDQLTREGFEVGIHGLYHDGRDLEPMAMLTERLPAMRQYADRWQAVGFRSPATYRVWERMPLLGFDYDSSYPDTDPFQPQSGGCCSLLPYFNQHTVELPITLPQDHTMFVILDRPDGSLWVEKAEHVRAQGGIALLITHPDYLDERLLEAYRLLLARYADDTTAWLALPRDVSAWWRRRAASRIERMADGWQVAGPAAGEATIAYTTTR